MAVTKVSPDEHVTGLSEAEVKQHALQMNIAKLSVKAIRSHNTTVQKFSSFTWTDDSDSFKFIMCEPPPSSSRNYNKSIWSGDDVSIDADEKLISDFAEFSKRVLLPRGFVIHFLQFKA